MNRMGLSIDEVIRGRNIKQDGFIYRKDIYRVVILRQTHVYEGAGFKSIKQ